MRVGLLALLGCMGCDVVFGLEERTPEPDPVPSAPTCRGPGEKVVLPLVADTYLDSTDDTPHGESSVLRVGDGRSVLLRFAAGSNSLQEIALTLTNATSAQACGNGDTCTSCAPGLNGSLAVHLMRPDWDEKTATHTLRSEAEPWSVPGAGGSDRSNRLCTTNGFDGLDAMCKFTFATTDLSPDWAGDLGVQVEAIGAATGVFGSREGSDQCTRTPVARAIATCRRVATCGNGIIDEGEGCDDRNSINGDGCTDGCAVETANPICGNAAIESGESCDDGNLNNNDGCSSFCMIEPPPVCGNMVKEGVEECDDGNSIETDTCDNNCKCYPIPCLPG